MRLVLGSLDHLPARQLTGWTPLQEPDAALALAIAFPIGLAMGSIVMVLWALAAPVSAFDVDPPTFMFMVAAVATLHELTHAAAFPRSRDPRSATLVLCPSRLVFCASYDGELSRQRLLWILAMPLFALSLAPTVAASAFAHAPGQLALLSLLNALVSGGDVLAILLVVAQVPSAAIVRRESDATLWKMMPALQ